VKFIVFVALTVFALFQPVASVASDYPSNQSRDLALEIFQMSKSLDELNSLLKAQQVKSDEFQRLQAAISYLSYRSRSIEMQEYDLRFKKERKDNIEKSIERLKEEIDENDRNTEIIKSEAKDNSALGYKDPKIILKRFEESFDDLGTEIIRIENEISISKNELASFEDYVQGKLELLN